MVKRGRKPDYIKVNGLTIRSSLFGYEVGLSMDKSTGTYYMMLPHTNPDKKYEKNFFGRDLKKAVKGFYRYLLARRKIIYENNIKNLIKRDIKRDIKGIGFIKVGNYFLSKKDYITFLINMYRTTSEKEEISALIEEIKKDKTMQDTLYEWFKK